MWTVFCPYNDLVKREFDDFDAAMAYLYINIANGVTVTIEGSYHGVSKSDTHQLYLKHAHKLD